MDAISQTTSSSAFSLMIFIGIQIKISLKFVPKGPINNIPALVQIMAWCRPGGRLNKKDGLTRYGNSHVKDKTSYRPSYL